MRSGSRILCPQAPFFCEKLNVRVLPTVICFFDGKTKPDQRVIGFAGLAKGGRPFRPGTHSSEESMSRHYNSLPPSSECPSDGDTDQDAWPTTRLEAKLGELGAIDYIKPATQEELRRYGLLDKSGITASVHRNTRGDDGDY